MIPAQAFLKQLQAGQLGIQPVLLVHGEEPLYNQKALQAYRAFLKQQGYLQRDRFEIEAHFKWQELQMETQAGSLFAEQRIIELDMPKGNPGKDGIEFILNWCAQLQPSLPPEICLIIRCEKLESRQIKSKWVQAIEGQGLVVQAQPIEARALPNWCQQRAQASSLSLTPEAAQLLAERVEGNLLAADQEIEKLALFFTSDSILTEQDIIENVVDQAHYQLFALSTAILTGRTEYALQILKRLQQESLEAPIILWLLAKEIRQAMALAKKQQQMPLGQAFQQLRIWKSKQAEYTAALRRHSLADWEGLLQQALAIDLAIKGVKKNDPWVGLSHLVFKMAQ